MLWTGFSSFSERDILSKIRYTRPVMSRRGQLLCLGLVFLLGGCAPVESPEQGQAESVAKAWLALVDSGQYEKAYEQYAARIRVELSKERFFELMRGRRAPFGSVISRRLVDAKFTHTRQGAPDGTYEILHYHSSFTGKASAVEEVVVTKESGNWEVSGYHFK